jgi:hypothetical protein
MEHSNIFSYDYLIYTAIAFIAIVIVYELYRTFIIKEGFSDGIDSKYFGKFFPRRSDVVLDQIEEQDGYVRNLRYTQAYADIQGLRTNKNDICRVVEIPNDPDSRMVVCALAGAEGFDTFAYKSPTVRSGFKISRDDYYRDVNGDGRDDYCRIWKTEKSPNDKWDAICTPAGLTSFKDGLEIIDSKPPPHIQELLFFYEGIMIWYRFIDDLLDYGENTKLSLAGDISIDETPKTIEPPVKCDGLLLNEVLDESTKSSPTQFIRIGENDKLEFENKFRLRDLRCFSCWVRFDEFTNNAPIFDFGNGPGRDNVRLAIESKGNKGLSVKGFNKRPIAQNNAPVCTMSSAIEQSPQKFLQSSDADVDTYECKGPEPVPSFYPDDEEGEETGPPTANLVFEIWDSQQRKMRIRTMNAIELKKWTHIAITTTDASSFRPTWQVYIDGELKNQEEAGHMPLNSYTTLNYIGKSNWEDVGSSQYDDRDEKFRGALFDMRFYRLPMSKGKIDKTILWGKQRLFKK